jgi:hypothetical protein
MKVERCQTKGAMNRGRCEEGKFAPSFKLPNFCCHFAK